MEGSEYDNVCLSVADSINEYIKTDKENFRFYHLLFNHRQQRYMMALLIENLENMEVEDPANVKKFGRMWWFYYDLHKAHAQVEDNFIHPVLMNSTISSLGEKNALEPKDVVHMIESQHKSMDETIVLIDQKTQQMIDADDNETVDTIRNELLEIIKSFAITYHRHVCLEEAKIAPLLHQLDASTQDKVAKEVKDFFQTRANGKQMLMAMRDVAISSPEDAEVWNNKMPWFLRNVVMFFLSFDSAYAEYLMYFPYPHGVNINEKYKRIVLAQDKK